MCTYICTYIYTHTYIHTYIFFYIHIHIHVWVCINIYIYIQALWATPPVGGRCVLAWAPRALVGPECGWKCFWWTRRWARKRSLPSSRMQLTDNYLASLVPVPTLEGWFKARLMNHVGRRTVNYAIYFLGQRASRACSRSQSSWARSQAVQARCNDKVHTKMASASYCSTEEQPSPPPMPLFQDAETTSRHLQHLQ